MTKIYNIRATIVWYSVAGNSRTRLLIPSAFSPPQPHIGGGGGLPRRGGSNNTTSSELSHTIGFKSKNPLPWKLDKYEKLVNSFIHSVYARPTPEQMKSLWTWAQVGEGKVVRRREGGSGGGGGGGGGRSFYLVMRVPGRIYTTA